MEPLQKVKAILNVLYEGAAVDLMNNKDPLYMTEDYKLAVEREMNIGDGEKRTIYLSINIEFSEFMKLCVGLPESKILELASDSMINTISNTGGLEYWMLKKGGK